MKPMIRVVLEERDVFFSFCSHEGRPEVMGGRIGQPTPVGR